MAVNIQRISDHEVIEVSMLRSYRPYDRLVLRDSIRVNDQWRIVFCWTEGGPSEVLLTDYH